MTQYNQGNTPLESTLDGGGIGCGGFFLALFGAILAGTFFNAYQKSKDIEPRPHEQKEDFRKNPPQKQTAVPSNKKPENTTNTKLAEVFKMLQSSDQKVRRLAVQKIKEQKITAAISLLEASIFTEQDLTLLQEMESVVTYLKKIQETEKKKK